MKYRSSVYQGGGFAAITPKKLQKMRFEAELYDVHHATAKNQRLAAVAVDARGAITLIEIE